MYLILILLEVVLIFLVRTLRFDDQKINIPLFVVLINIGCLFTTLSFLIWIIVSYITLCIRLINGYDIGEIVTFRSTNRFEAFIINIFRFLCKSVL